VINVRELADKIEADKQSVEDLAGPMAGLKDEIEGLAAQARALGVEQVAGVLDQAKGVLEEAESGRVVLQGGLEKARWQVMSAVHGNLGPGAMGSGPGGSFIAADGKVITADGGSAIPHLDAIPPHLRQDPSPTGEELMGSDPSIGPLEKEHEGANDDKQMGGLSRFGRKAVRNMGDLVEQSKQIADVRADTFEQDYDPWGPTAQTTTEVPSAPPSTPTFGRIDADSIRTGDVVGTSIVVAVIAVEGLSRLLRKKDHGK
jgi:hypothetical protein